ncbi:MAG: efflux RND transporter periplasmic adaptor subunit [Terriglobales bacterium]
MATSRPGYVVPYADLATALLAASEVVPRARLIAEQAIHLVPDGAAVVYMLDERDGWVPKATAGEVAFQSTVEAEVGTLGEVAERKEALVFDGSELPREAYAHLNVRRTLVSLAVIPLIANDRMVGAMEVLSFEEPISDAALAALADLGAFTALGLASSIAYENERNNQLQSITRITQMYDLEKVFNATLEMEQLLPVITAKFQDIVSVQAVNLWMVEGDGLLLMSSTGADPAYELNERQSGSEGIASAVADSGEAVVIDSPDDERLQKRNAKVEEGAAFSLMAAPILHQGAVVGVVEAINKLDGSPFDEDDLFLLSTMCETASNALHNASLLMAERKVEILEALVQVSHEITSTLNLDRVIQSIVNGAQAVIPYERAALALEEQGRLRLRAVSGLTKEEINLSDASISALNEILQWTTALSEEIYIRQHDDEVDEPREETRAKFQKYFSDTGVRGFYAVPLADDTGRLGILCFESSDPDFLSTAHLEMIKVLAGQATVALRNASLYKEVPFIGVLAPILQRKQQFLAMEQRRRRTMLTLAGAALVALVVVPLPMRVDGVATVAPSHMARIQPEVEGVVRQVYVREGDDVSRGTVLADLEDWDYRAALAAAEAKRGEAIALANRALASNDGTEAGIQRVQADYWAAEVARARERLERTHLRSPIDGVVTTPRIENLVGRHLEYGDTFAEVADTRSATVDVAVADSDVPLLEPGEAAVVKLDAFPTHTFKGKLEVISPLSQVQEEHRVFFARVTVPNEDKDALMRTGMQGRGKIDARAGGMYPAGWRPAGYVLFRGLGMWVRTKLWSWLGL